MRKVAILALLSSMFVFSVAFYAGASSESAVPSQGDSTAAVDLQTVTTSLTTTLPDEPWAEVGLSPIGQYFKNLDEYVSTSSGLLTVYQQDFFAPGRDLDLLVARIYQTPGMFTGSIPYGTAGSPYANLGPGWVLDLPWIGGGYLHWWKGQQFKETLSQNDGTQTMVNHKYGHFTLTKVDDVQGGSSGDPSFTTIGWDLLTPDGNQYEFDGTGKLTEIRTLNGNVMTFSYNNYTIGYDDENSAIVAARLTKITDTIGRTVSLTHQIPDDRLQSVTISGPGTGTTPRTTQYRYTAGKLAYVDDPMVAAGSTQGHTTEFRYSSSNAYLLTEIIYPTGGSSTYQYDNVSGNGGELGTLYKYRVTSHKREVKRGSADQGDFWRRYSYTMRTAKWYRVATCTVETMERPDDPNVKLKEVFDLEDSDMPVVLKHTTYDPAGKTLRKLEYGYNTNKEKTRLTETKYGLAGLVSSPIIAEWTYDTWGNIVRTQDPSGLSVYTAYANGNGSTASGMWTSSDFYMNSIDSTIHDRPIGSYYTYQSADGSIARVETFHLYDTVGNLIETKQRLDSPEGTRWIRARNLYTTANGVTYGPTRIIRGYHLAVADQIITDVEYQHMLFPIRRTTAIESAVVDPITMQESAPCTIETRQTFWPEIGKAATKTDGNGRTTELQYDLLGRPTRTVYPQRPGEVGRLAAALEYPVVNGVTTSLGYYGIWDGQSVTSKTRLQEHIFDGLGREAMVKTYLSEGAYASNSPYSMRTLSYNWLGMVAKEEIKRSDSEYPYTFVTYYEYEPLGRVIKAINPDGSSRTTTYDDARDWTGDGVADGSVKTVVDEVSNTKEYFYDWPGRLIKVIEYASGHPGDPNTKTVVTSYDHNPTGSLRKVTDGRGKETVHKYDSLNRLVTVQHPAGNPSLTAYDDFGRIKTKTDPKLTVTTYHYDKSDRLTLVELTDASGMTEQVASYKYDRAGNQVLAVNSYVTAKRVPDELNRIKIEERTIGGKTFTTTFEYNSLGLLVETGGPSGKRVGYQYDGSGRVSRIHRGTQATDPLLATYEYYPVGLTSHLTFGNGVATTYRLDGYHPRINQIAATNSLTQTLLELDYAFGLEGNVRTINQDSFTYDGLGRLLGSEVF